MARKARATRYFMAPIIGRARRRRDASGAAGRARRRLARRCVHRRWRWRWAAGSWVARGAEGGAAGGDRGAGATLPPLDQRSASLAHRRADSSLLHRPVALRGLWLAGRTVYLDNRQMHGVPGFYVVTPLRSRAAEPTVLVQRGWVQRNFSDRDAAAAGGRRRAGTVEVARAASAAAARPSLYRRFGAAASSGVSRSGKISTWTRSAPKPACRCCRRLGAADRRRLRRPAARLAGTPAAASKSTTAMPSSGSASRALVAILYVWFQFIAPCRRARRAACLTSRWA